jgi:hypothetical protein
MGIKTTVAAVTPRADHVAAAQSQGRQPNDLLVLAAEKAQELAILLTTLKYDMQGGDGNIATIATQIANLS